MSIADKVNSLREYFVMFWRTAGMFSIRTAKDEKKIKIDSLIDVYDFLYSKQFHVKKNGFQIGERRFSFGNWVLLGANYAFSDYDEVISI